MEDQEIPKVKELIVYYETAAAEDKRKADSLRRRLKRIERQEKRRSRQMSRLQEMSLPKLRKQIKISSPGAKKTPQKKKVEEPTAEVEISQPDGIALAPLPAPLFDAPMTETIVEESKIEECQIENLLSECADIMVEEEPAAEVVVEPTVEVVVAVEAPARVVSEPELVAVEILEPAEVVEQQIEIQEVEKCVEIAPQKDSIRTMVAQEILSTERSYVEGLRKCISVRHQKMNHQNLFPWKSCLGIISTHFSVSVALHGTIEWKNRRQRASYAVWKPPQHHEIE
jgi:hypothetical protein